MKITIARAMSEGISAKQLIDVAKWHESRKSRRHADIAENLREVAETLK